jgi:sentrin-specific protease 1
MLQLRDETLSKMFPGRRRSHIFNSFFMEKLVEDCGRYNFDGIKRWSKKFDVLELDKVIIPINISNCHWTLGAIFVQKKEIHYYDSMGSTGQKYLDAMWQWVFDEVKAKKRILLNKSEWTILPVPETPQQNNGTDCGVFTIISADFLMDNMPILESTYSQADMPFFRQKIMNDILRGYLDYPDLIL